MKAVSPQKTAPPVCVEDSFSLTVTDTQTAARNFVDCTESNDEEEGDEEEEEEKTTEVKGSDNPPKWEDFFTAGTLPDSQNSLSSQLQSCCSNLSPAPSKLTGSLTPDLFSDEEEEIPNDDFSLTLSTSLSNHSSQNQDSSSYLPDTLILQSEQRGRDQGDSRTSTIPQEIQAELEELSQVSSDFDVPCTPESKVPQPEELTQLYRKLASGEEVVVRTGSQGAK